MAAAGGQPCLLAQDVHVCGASAEARQNADLHRHAPAAGLHQGRLVEVVGEALHRIGVVLHHQLIDQFPQGPQLPVLEPMVVGKPEGAGGEADDRPLRPGHLGQMAPQLPQQPRQLLAPPAHPSPVGGAGGGFQPRLGAVEPPGVVVVAQLHGPGEMVIELDAIGAAALHHLADQADEPGPHPRVRRIQPHP